MAIDTRSAHRRVATIGVYGWTLPGFLDALHEVNVRMVIDVRQRRGVRGSQYSWANVRRLQAALAAVQIGYRHCKELAPTTELRQLQYAADDRLGVGKRARVALDPEYRERYIQEILDHVDLDEFVAQLAQDGASTLLCVERDPESCHRGLIAERLAQRYGMSVLHLRPDDDPPAGDRGQEPAATR